MTLTTGLKMKNNQILILRNNKECAIKNNSIQKTIYLFWYFEVSWLLQKPFLENLIDKLKYIDSII